MKTIPLGILAVIAIAALSAPQTTAGATAPSSGGTAYDISQIDQAPRVLAQKAPVYPAGLKEARVSGSVLIEFVVGPDGTVTDAAVVKSSRNEFEAPALEAVRAWKFDAGKKDGEAVSTRMQVPIEFSTPKK